MGAAARTASQRLAAERSYPHKLRWLRLPPGYAFVVSRYFKRRWNESRGDHHDAWGTSLWYLQLDDAGYPERQLEVYESGDTLAYDEALLDDEYGGLGDQPLDLREWHDFEITPQEFEIAWSTAKPRNR